MRNKLPFLKVDKTRIVDESGKEVRLKGVCLGGWLMMEGYILGGRNIPERAFREGFKKALGDAAHEDFTRSFRDTFIRRYDIEIIKGWGANCVRVPFNYRIVEFEDRPFSFNEKGIGYLDRVVEWCEKLGIYCILDMHAVPGSQNMEWHSDSYGSQEFLSNDFNKDRYYRLWHFLADRYRSSSAVAGYDIMNEPVVPVNEEGVLKDVYERVTREIRDADKNHIIFLEPNMWTRIFFLGKPKDQNTAYSAHPYLPNDFTFNFQRDLHYPGKVSGINWSGRRFELVLKPYLKFITSNEVPLYIGEFGVNWRGGLYGELKWVKDFADIFEKCKLHWTYWTYKSVANAIHPDGIFRFVKNPPWVNRQGPLTGMETFHLHWMKEKGRMISSWRTENFVRNDKLYSLLRRYFK